MDPKKLRPSSWQQGRSQPRGLKPRIAQEQQVDAVWPGWGHASENPKLPAKLKEPNIMPCHAIIKHNIR